MKKAILQEKDICFEEMVAALELTECELQSQKRSDSCAEQAFYSGASRREKCIMCQRSGHNQTNCWLNPKSKKFRPKYRPTGKIKEQLKKLNLTTEGSTPRNHNSDPKNADRKDGEMHYAFVASGGAFREKWFLDSCASRHLTNQKRFLKNCNPIQNESVNSAIEGSTVNIEGIGDITVSRTIDGKETKQTLLQVGYAPNIRTNLISLGKVQGAGITINFPCNSTTMVANAKGKTMMIGSRKESKICELTNMKAVKDQSSQYIMLNSG